MAAVLIVLGLFLVLLLVSGVPRILKLPGLPRELRFEEVPDSALTPAQAAHLSRLDAVCDGLHYRPVFNIRVTNLASDNLSRFYLSSADPALLLTSLLRVKTGKGGDRSADYLEIITRFGDGTELTTSSSGTSTPFDRPPNRIVQKFPGLDPVRLKERHDQAAAPLLSREPVWLQPSDILERWRASHRQWCEHQEGKGLLRYDQAVDSYRLTTPVARRGVANFLNPLGGPLTARRLLALALFGIALPSAGILALQAAPVQVAQAAALLHLPAYMAVRLGVGLLCLQAGVVSGLVFGQKHFVGTLLVGLAPAMILGRSSVLFALVALLIVESAAVQASAWQDRRRRLL